MEKYSNKVKLREKGAISDLMVRILYRLRQIGVQGARIVVPCSILAATSTISGLPPCPGAQPWQPRNLMKKCNILDCRPKGQAPGFTDLKLQRKSSEMFF